jgi:hypothetical protein
MVGKKPSIAASDVKNKAKIAGLLRGQSKNA